jgi:hypothetical protein
LDHRSTTDTDDDRFDDDEVHHNDGLAFDIPHQRNAQLLNTPCLVSHRIIWHAYPIKPDDFKVGLYRATPQSQAIITHERHDPRSLVAYYINKFIDILKRRNALHGDRPQRFTDDYDVMRRARKGEIDVGPITPIYLNRTLGLSGCLNGLEFEVAIDIHNDYHTLCFRAFPLANDAAGYTCEEFKKAALLLKKLSEHGDDKASGHGASSLELLYEDFWDRFEDSIKNNEFKEFSYQGAREAVFRGIILRTVKLKEQLQIHSRGPLAPNSTRNGPDSYVINTDFPKPNEKTPRQLEGPAANI